MRLIGAAVAAVAAWVWFSRRRRSAVAGTPSAAVDVTPASPRPQPVPMPEPDVTAPPETAPRLNDTGRLDASAGWDDLDGKPASAVAARHPEVRTTAPGLPGDDAQGVPAWDRPV